MIVTGTDTMSASWVVTERLSSGGEAGRPPQPRKTLLQRNHQWRRRRMNWTLSWRELVEPTSPRPSYVWCRLRSLTRAGEFSWCLLDWKYFIAYFMMGWCSWHKNSKREWNLTIFIWKNEIWLFQLNDEMQPGSNAISFVPSCQGNQSMTTQ